MCATKRGRISIFEKLQSMSILFFFFFSKELSIHEVIQKFSRKSQAHKLSKLNSSIMIAGKSLFMNLFALSLYWYFSSMRLMIRKIWKSSPNVSRHICTQPNLFFATLEQIQNHFSGKINKEYPLSVWTGFVLDLLRVKVENTRADELYRFSSNEF